jgi:hypothetical protein
MTTAFPTNSKCPNCGKEYIFLEVYSYTVYGDFTDKYLRALFEDYIKTCECGLTFDMSKNKIAPEISMLKYEYSAIQKEMMESVLKGFSFNKEDADKKRKEIFEIGD